MIRHIVLFRMRDGIAQAELDATFASLHALKAEISGILAITSGANDSPERLERGYTHAFTVDFIDPAARDAYLPHPEHIKVAETLVAAADGGVDGILVLDYAM